MKRTLSALFLLCMAGLLNAQESAWTVADISGVTGNRYINPHKAYYFTTDLSLAESQLVLAPMEGTAGGLNFAIPGPDGNLQHFEVWKYEMMEPGLQSQYPGISTYLGKGIDDPYALVRIDLTYQGFHAYVLSPSGTWSIDPVFHLNTTYYQSYYKSQLDNPYEFTCQTMGEQEEEIPEIPGAENLLPNGSTRKNYRLAMAATGEYTAFHGGTVQLALSAIVTAMNRVNGIYERDAAVRMTLIANTNSVIYTNATTDPFTNNDGGTMLGENQSNMTSVIGGNNYDIGHVFSTGGGGIAQLGCVCSGSNKARGVTGLPNPIGDGFYVDYVCHEMGHQFNAGHTFNSSAGSCNGNRSSQNAYEPGSGSTIMSYSGICAPDNIQSNSHDIFHVRSYRSIVTFITTGSGNNCDAPAATGNNAPTVNAGNGGFTIPKSTPFRLTANAQDANGDVILYSWEEYDLGNSVALASNPTSGTHPLFRCYDLDSSPTRVFPRMSTIVNNLTDNKEKLPYYGRAMNFRVIVRDNKPNGGGASYDTIGFNVSNTIGPFEVTSPNTLVAWQEGTTQTVTWNVAGSNQSPVSCSSVNIRLSTDGGYTYPIMVLAGTPNDGSQSITVPILGTTINTCRIMVEAAANIFFDISNTNFTIQTGPVIAPDASFTASDNEICAGDALSFTDNSLNSPTSWAWTFQGGIPGSSTMQNPSGIAFMNAGTFQVTLVATNGGGSDTYTSSITVNPVPAATFTTTPATGGNNNGTATANITGGTPPYTYQWITSPIQTTPMAVNLYAGNNTLIVTDSNGCTQTFVVVVPSDVNVEEEEIFFMLYPVPAAGSLTIKNTTTDTYTWKMLDVSGRIMNAGNYTGSQATLSLEGINSGMYLLEISSTAGQSIQRFVKE